MKKILIIATIVIFLILGSVLFYKITSDDENSNNDDSNKTEESHSSSCTDSDNGKNPFEYGSAIYKDSRTGSIIHTTVDNCAEKLDVPEYGVEYVDGLEECTGDKCYVKEGYCDEYQDSLIDKHEYIKCDNGCKDGACIRE